MKTNHTKGPWLVTDEGSQIVIQTFEYHPTGTLARMYGTDDLAKADAQLMAAAPELLKAATLALQIAEAWIHDQLDGTSSLKSELARLRSVRKAIAKATGATR